MDTFKPLTPEQYQSARNAGFSHDQIVTNEQQRKSQSGGMASTPTPPPAPTGNAGYGYVKPPAIQAPPPESQHPLADAGAKSGTFDKIVKGGIGVLNSIEKPFVGLASTPVQLLAKAIGQPDPFEKNPVPGFGGTNVPSSKLGLEQKLGDAAQIASYAVPGEGVLGAVGMGALQGAGSAMSEGKDLATVATQGAEGGLVGGATGGAVKLGGGLLKTAGGLISGKAADDAVSGIKNAYGSSLNLNAAERAFEGRSGKDIANVLMENKAPLGRNPNGTLDATTAIQKLQAALDPLNAQAETILTKPQGVVQNVSLNDTFTQVQKRIQALSISQAEKNSAIAHAKELIGAEAKQYGESVTPDVADKIKQGFWGSSFKGKLTSADKLQGNVSYLTGNTLKDSIEKSVAGTDAGNVLGDINKKRSDLIDAIKRLTTMDGVRILKGGKLGNMAGGIVGTMAGVASGAGPLGALAGDYFGTKAAEFLQDPATKIGVAGLKAKAAGAIPGLLGDSAKPIGNALTKAGSVVKKGTRAAGLLGNVLTNTRQ